LAKGRIAVPLPVGYLEFWAHAMALSNAVFPGPQESARKPAGDRFDRFGANRMPNTQTTPVATSVSIGRICMTVRAGNAA